MQHCFSGVGKLGILERALSLGSNIPSSTLSSHVTLGQFMDVSEPQFPIQNYKCTYLASKRTLKPDPLTASISKLLNQSCASVSLFVKGAQKL